MLIANWKIFVFTKELGFSVNIGIVRHTFHQSHHSAPVALPPLYEENNKTVEHEPSSAEP